MKKLLVAAATSLALALPVATVTVSLTGPALAAHTVVPANYLRGRVEAINTQTRVVTIAGHQFTGFTVSDLTHLKVGEECEVTYVADATAAAGPLRALIIEHVDDNRVVN